MVCRGPIPNTRVDTWTHTHRCKHFQLCSMRRLCSTFRIYRRSRLVIMREQARRVRVPQGCRSSCAWQFPHYGVHEHHVFSQSPALDEAPGLRAGHQGTNNGTIICKRAAPAASLHGLLRRFCLRRLALLRPPSLRRLAPHLPMLSSSSRSSSSPRDLAVHDCDQRRIPTSVPALCSSRSSSPMLASRRASHQHSPPPSDPVSPRGLRAHCKGAGRCGSGVAKGHEGHAAEMRRCMRSEGQLSVLLGKIERPGSCGKRLPHALPGEIEGK